MKLHLANVTATLLLVTCVAGCAPWAYRVRPAHLHLPPDGQPALVVPVGEPGRPIEVEWAMSSAGRKLRLDSPADLAALRAEVARNPGTEVALMRRITGRDHAGLLGCGLAGGALAGALTFRPIMDAYADDLAVEGVLPWAAVTFGAALVSTLACSLPSLWPGEATIVPAVELARPATADRG